MKIKTNPTSPTNYKISQTTFVENVSLHIFAQLEQFVWEYEHYLPQEPFLLIILDIFLPQLNKRGEVPVVDACLSCDDLFPLVSSSSAETGQVGGYKIPKHFYCFWSWFLIQICEGFRENPEFLLWCVHAWVLFPVASWTGWWIRTVVILCCNRAEFVIFTGKSKHRSILRILWRMFITQISSSQTYWWDWRLISGRWEWRENYESEAWQSIDPAIVENLPSVFGQWHGGT